MTREMPPFPEALDADLRYLYKHGFQRPVEPVRLPAMSELATSLTPTARTNDEAVEGLLDEAIAEAARQLVPTVHRRTEIDIGRAITELLGVIGDSGQGLEGRRDKAGLLLGYSNGNDGLRKAIRGGRHLTDVILDEVRDALVQMAERSGFVYKGLLGAGDESVLPIPPSDSRLAMLDALFDTKPPIDTPDEGLKPTMDALNADLVRIENVGFQVTLVDPAELIPSIAYVANLCFRDWDDPGFANPTITNAEPEHLEAVLCWAVLRGNSQRDAEGLAELYGFGKVRGLNRSGRSARVVGHGDFLIRMGSLQKMFVSHLFDLAIQSGFVDRYLELRQFQPRDGGG